MKVFSLEECCKTDYNISFLGSVELPQKTEYPAFSSLGYPKKQDMILFVNDCQTRYTSKDGKILSTKNGDVVYVPKESQYRVECIQNGDNGCTMQINFLLFDDKFEPFVLSNDIKIFSYNNPNLRSLFEKSIMLSNNAAVYPAMQKAILFELLATLSQTINSVESSSIIEKGINFLLSHYDENPSIPTLASMCNVSNEYFRKLFKIQMGQTPSEYKNSLRIKKAEQYLLYSDLPLIEISERLSFATVSHFIKCFKEKHGCAPLAYRNKFNKKE